MLDIIFIDVIHETAPNSSSQGQDDVVHIPEGDVVKAKQGKQIYWSIVMVCFMNVTAAQWTYMPCLQMAQNSRCIPLGNHPSNKPEEVTKTFRPVSRWSTLYFVDGARPRIQGHGSYTYVNLSRAGLNVHVTACVYIDKFKVTWVHILDLFPIPSTAFGPWSARTPCHLFMKQMGCREIWPSCYLWLPQTSWDHSIRNSQNIWIEVDSLCLVSLLSPFPSQSRLGAIFTLPRLGWSDTSSTANTEPAQKQGSSNPPKATEKIDFFGMQVKLKERGQCDQIHACRIKCTYNNSIII